MAGLLAAVSAAASLHWRIYRSVDGDQHPCRWIAV